MAGLVDVYQRPIWDLGSVADAVAASADIEAGSGSYDFGPVWHNCTPNDLVATPTVEGLSLSQEHALTASDLLAASAVDAGTAAQYHNTRPLDLVATATVDPADVRNPNSLTLQGLTAQPTLSHHFETVPLDLVATASTGRPQLNFVSRSYASQHRHNVTVRQIATSAQNVRAIATQVNSDRITASPNAYPSQH